MSDEDTPRCKALIEIEQSGDLFVESNESKESKESTDSTCGPFTIKYYKYVEYDHTKNNDPLEKEYCIKKRKIESDPPKNVQPTRKEKVFSISLFNPKYNPNKQQQTGGNVSAQPVHYVYWFALVASMVRHYTENCGWELRLYIDDSFTDIEMHLPDALQECISKQLIPAPFFVYKVQMNCKVVKPLGIASFMRYLCLSDPSVTTCMHLDADNIPTPMFLEIVNRWANETKYSALCFFGNNYLRMSYKKPKCTEISVSALEREETNQADFKYAVNSYMAGMCGIKKQKHQVLNPTLIQKLVDHKDVIIERKYWPGQVKWDIAHKMVDKEKNYYGYDEVILTEFIIPKINNVLKLELLEFGANVEIPNHDVAYNEFKKKTGYDLKTVKISMENYYPTLNSYTDYEEYIGKCKAYIEQILQPTNMSGGATKRAPHTNAVAVLLLAMTTVVASMFPR